MNVVRMQFDMPEARLAQLKEVMETCGLATQKDLINNALTLFEWAVKQRQEGRVISSVDEKNKKWKELSMPALEHVTKSSTARMAARTSTG